MRPDLEKDIERQRIVITGVGVVAPNGIGKEEFWANCAAGVSGIKRITLFDTSKYRCHYAGEISNFQPERYLGSKGLRNLDRTTLLSLVAAKLAIDDAHLEITDANRNDIGVVLGSTMGSVHSISEFDKEGLREGPRYVNPAHFPNTVINAPASQVAIRFGLRGLNSTISTGFSASLDAIGYAIDMLNLGRTKILLVGGVEELCIQTFLGFYKLRFLAMSPNGSAPFFKPFDEHRRGALLGEGAAFFVLETLEDAQRREAQSYAELLGYGTYFDPDAMYRYNPGGKGPAAAMRQALDDAGVVPDDIDYVSACANSTKICDASELTAFETVFGPRVGAVQRQTAKMLLGESFSADAALQLAAMLGEAVPQEVRNPQKPLALIDCFGPTGTSSALVVRLLGHRSHVSATAGSA